jgi:hypothetical protein
MNPEAVTGTDDRQFPATGIYECNSYCRIVMVLLPKKVGCGDRS